MSAVPDSLKQDFERDGYYFPLLAMHREEANAYRVRLENHEASSGGILRAGMRHQTHLLFTWADQLIRHTAILDAVEAVIGPDLLCWSTSFFIKEPHTADFVSWHQDATYWGLEPHDQIVTAWVALSDVPVESGAMKFLAGSHKQGQLAHEDTFDEHNLLTRGQEVALDVNEDEAADVALRAGEFSLHHVLLAHGSHPNTTDYRRIGFAIRYIPTSVRQTKIRDTAVLVRGADRFGHFELINGPLADLDREALAAHANSTTRLQTALYSGTGRTRFPD